jgi:cyclopropane fatty-acyl-phospholipid synthase-like methyltransferase
VGLELTRRLDRTFRGQKIVEFGAGNGDLSHHLESMGNEVTAIEVSSEAFAKIHCTRKILGDAFTLAELDESFDTFASVDVLEHLTENDIQLVLREAGRLADNLYLSVSTRLSGLLGPKGENLHLTVRSSDWWMEQVGRYFDVRISNGYGTGQIVLEGKRKKSLPAVVGLDAKLRPSLASSKSDGLKDVEN